MADTSSYPKTDLNRLFNPAAAEGTWITCLDAASKQDRVVYVELRVIVSPFPLAVD